MPYACLAINAAFAVHPALRPAVSARSVASGALIEGQWVAFPDHTQIEGRPSSIMVWPGRVTETGEVEIMMVEAEATEQTFSLVRSGTKAKNEEVVPAVSTQQRTSHASCARPSRSSHVAASRRGVPVFLEYEEDA